MDWRHPKGRDAQDADALYIMQIRFILTYTKNEITKPTRDFQLSLGRTTFLPRYYFRFIFLIGYTLFLGLFSKDALLLHNQIVSVRPLLIVIFRLCTTLGQVRLAYIRYLVSRGLGTAGLETQQRLDIGNYFCGRLSVIAVHFKEKHWLIIILHKDKWHAMNPF